MTRLPKPGHDAGTWGNLLNDFLRQAHNDDGSLKPLNQSQIQNLVGDLASKVNTTDLKLVATSGSYTDLTNKPTIPSTAADVGAVSVTGLDAATAGLVNSGNSTTSGALHAALTTSWGSPLDRARLGGLLPLPSAGLGPVQHGLIKQSSPQIDTHAGCPSIELLPDGRIIKLWRDASGHAGGIVGTLQKSYSSDGMKSWTAPALMYSDVLDARDPTVRLSRDGTRLFMTYFTYPATGTTPCKVYFKISTDSGATWSPSVQVGSDSFTLAATCPVLELNNGNLVIFAYGKQTSGQTQTSAYTYTSVDGGTTWGAAVVLADGPAAGVDYPEPMGVMDSLGRIWVTMRYNNTQSIAIMYSDDQGLTYTAPSAIFAGSGRAQLIPMSTGPLLVLYRLTTPVPYGAYRVSYDRGVSWGPQIVYDLYTVQSTYASGREVSKGVVAVQSGAETGVANGSTSTISGLYFMHGAGTSPLNDEVLASAPAAISRSDQIQVFDRFLRGDGPLGSPEIGRAWTVSGSLKIVGGVMQSTLTGSTIYHADIDSGLTEVDIEAEIRWQSNAGVGVEFRKIDDSNYLLLNIESGGSGFNLYKVVGGVPTALSTSTEATRDGIFHKVRVMARRDAIRVFLDGARVHSVILSAGDMAQFGPATRHGIRSNTSTVGALHLIRRFVVLS